MMTRIININKFKNFAIIIIMLIEKLTSIFYCKEGVNFFFLSLLQLEICDINSQDSFRQ